MLKPPYAAAVTAVLITLAGGPFGLGEAQARAIYTGTFDPRGDVYGFEGTHKFEVDDACLTSTGWKAANGNGGYGYDMDTTAFTEYNSCGAVVLTGGSLTLRKYAAAGTGDNGTRVIPDVTFDFSQATDWIEGYGMSAYILGIYVAFNPLTGRNELAGVDTPRLFGTFGAFDDQYWALEWVSTKVPVGFTALGGGGGEGEGYDSAYEGPDPVFLYQATCGAFGCPLTPAAVPGAIPTFDRVPEPGSLALAGLALAALGSTVRRRSVR